MRTHNLKDTNTFYAPAEDECWVLLAKEIMASYASSYTSKLPLFARSQAEYDDVDKKSCVPIRRSILRNIKNGPLKNVVNIQSTYSGLERVRMEYKSSLGIPWQENNSIDLENL